MRNFKRIAVIAVFLAACVILNQVLNYMLIPYGYARVDYHNLRTVEYDDLFIGTSHGLSTINPEFVDEVTGGVSLNFCMGGEYLRDSYYIVQEACRNRVPKRVIYELDPAYWITQQNEDFEYGRLYEEMPWSFVKLKYFFAKMADADFRTTLFPWFNYRSQLSNIGRNIQVKSSDDYLYYGVQSFDGDGQAFLNNGFVYRKEILSGGEKARYAPINWSEDNIYQESLTYFKKLVNFCADKGIELIVITTPIPQETQEAYADEFDASYNYFSNLTAQYGVEYCNFNYEEINFDRSIDSFGDFEGHMYGDKAEIFSKIVGTYLNSLNASDEDSDDNGDS